MIYRTINSEEVWVSDEVEELQKVIELEVFDIFGKKIPRLLNNIRSLQFKFLTSEKINN